MDRAEEWEEREKVILLVQLGYILSGSCTCNNICEQFSPCQNGGKCKLDSVPLHDL